jgi:hypothetical protein
MAAAGKTAGVVGRRKGPESDSVLTVAGRGGPAARMWQIPRHGCGRPAAPMWQVPRHGCGGPAAPMWQVPRHGCGGPAAPMWQGPPAWLRRPSGADVAISTSDFDRFGHACAAAVPL